MKVITQEQKEKLIAMNNLIAIEEVKAFSRYEILQKQLEEMVIEKIIWDYNIDLKLSCFTSNLSLNIKYNTDGGNPVFEWSGAIYEIFCDRKKHPEWNEVDYFRGTIMEKFRFCYTFYCILCYSDLSIEEILLIESIWIEVPVDYQWEVEFFEV